MTNFIETADRAWDGDLYLEKINHSYEVVGGELVKTTSYNEVSGAKPYGIMGGALIDSTCVSVRRVKKSSMKITGREVLKYFPISDDSRRLDYSDNGSDDGMRGNFDMCFRRAEKVCYTLADGSLYTRIENRDVNASGDYTSNHIYV